MQRILILNHDARTPDTGGGVRHYEMGMYLADLGHKVMIVGSSYDNESKRYYTDEPVEVRHYSENLTFIRLHTEPAYRTMYGRLLNYMDFRKKAAAYDYSAFEPTAVIGSSIHPLAWPAARDVARRFDVPFLAEVRDLWPLSMYEDLHGLKKFLVFTYFEGLERKYYGCADGIITTAPYAWEYMQEKYGTDPAKVHFIPHGIDVEHYDANARRSDEELPQELRELLDTRYCITYTGALSESEGLESFVEAGAYLTENPEVYLVVIGSGDEKEELLRIVKEKNLNNVRFFDKMNRDLIPLVLKKSKILFTGLKDRKAFYYGISKNKFYDYMASAKPVVFASNVRGSLIDRAECGVTIPPGDAKNLAAVFVKIRGEGEAKAAEYGANGRRYLEENHTVAAVGDAFLDAVARAKERKDKRKSS